MAFGARPLLSARQPTKAYRPNVLLAQNVEAIEGRVLTDCPKHIAFDEQPCPNCPNLHAKLPGNDPAGIHGTMTNAEHDEWSCYPAALHPYIHYKDEYMPHSEYDGGSGSSGGPPPPDPPA